MSDALPPIADLLSPVVGTLEANEGLEAASCRIVVLGWSLYVSRKTVVAACDRPLAPERSGSLLVVLTPRSKDQDFTTDRRFAVNGFVWDPALNDLGFIANLELESLVPSPTH